MYCRTSFLALACLLATAPLFAAPVSGAAASVPQQPAAGATPAGQIGAAGSVSKSSAFDVEVHAPDEVRELIERHSELQRYRAVADLDEAEYTRLMVLAERDVRNLLGAMGYFSPTVAVRREGRPDQRPVLVIDVNPGVATRIKTLELDFRGDIDESNDPQAVAQRERIRDDWRLKPGDRFSQADWDDAKADALRQLLSQRYPRGEIAISLADIDAPSAAATLHLRLNSGPLYRIGALQVEGAQRYDAVLAQRLARLPPGQPYDQQQLLDAQQRLVSSGYYDSAYLSLDTQGPPEAAPVRLQVSEARLQKVTVGMGVSTDNGMRLNLEHRHNRVPGIDWRAVTKLEFNRSSQGLESEWTSMPDDAGWRWALLGQLAQVDIGDFVVNARKLRMGRVKSDARFDRNVYIQYESAGVRSPVAGALGLASVGDGSALSVNSIWTARYFDSLPFPARGYGLGAELGGGFTLGNSRLPFVRAVGRGLAIVPMAYGDSRVALRAAAGAVWAAERARVPSSQLFLTGGDSTVRGYAYQALGEPTADGRNGPGRYMAVLSAEWQRPILTERFPGLLEHTVFVDAGGVANRAQDVSLNVGVGTGVRLKTPVGPMQIDLAYGLTTERLRLHMNVGFVF